MPVLQQINPIDRHLWADCLENIAASTSHKHISLHGLFNGSFFLLIREQTVLTSGM
jgi:hypothetical protein